MWLWQLNSVVGTSIRQRQLGQNIIFKARRNIILKKVLEVQKSEYRSNRYCRISMKFGTQLCIWFTVWGIVLDTNPIENRQSPYLVTLYKFVTFQDIYKLVCKFFPTKQNALNFFILIYTSLNLFRFLNINCLALLSFLNTCLKFCCRLMTFLTI